MHSPSQNPSTPPPSEIVDVKTLDQLLHQQDADNAKMRRLGKLMDETQKRINQTSEELLIKKSH
jgi:hypothetical protein